MTPRPPLVLYDGHCGLCQRSVRFLLRYERSDLLRFAALRSPLGQQLLRERGVPEEVDALVFIEGERTLTGADAALALCAYLKTPIRWLRLFGVLPAPLRARLYRAVARRRYRWFGQTETCPLPAPEQSERFLD